MYSIQSRTPTYRRLRFVFSDAVMSFNIDAGATLEDVALKLGDPALRVHGRPIGIDVAIPAGH